MWPLNQPVRNIIGDSEWKGEIRSDSIKAENVKAVSMYISVKKKSVKECPKTGYTIK